jgi:Zn-dependent peptidase ImmA (M78 family)/transcriptional regulator with XRE-family HTH domain
MFTGKRIRQARELRLLTQGELSTRVGRTQGAIAHVETGFKDPSEDLIAAIAQETRFPVAFFSREPTAEFPLDSVMFRARAATSRRTAVAACRYAELVYEVAETLSRRTTVISPQLPKIKGPASHAAQQTRSSLGIAPNIPIGHVTDAIERSGVLVLAVPLQVEGLDAFSAWIGDAPKKPVIAVCGVRAGDRLRFSLAHELGHLLMHSDGRLRSEEHSQADQFAAEFLMPDVAMRREVTKPVTLLSIARLKPAWGVSIQALIRRVYEIGILSRRQYRYLFEQLSIKGWRGKEPSNLDVPVEKPRALRKMAELAYGLPPDYKKLASEVALSVEMVRKILEGYEDRLPVARPQFEQLSLPLA